MAVAAAERQTPSVIDSYLETGAYLYVDDIPEAYVARQAVRLGAEALLEERRKARVQGGEAAAGLPLSVDALSTADQVLIAERVYGKKSQEYLECRKGLILDSQRLLGEWYRKKKAEYFKPVRHVRQANGEYFSHGMSTTKMTENGITPMPDDPEEEGRRVNEHVEDVTPTIVMSLGCVALDTKVRTISECKNKAIRDYASDVKHGRKHRGYDGQVPEIEKQFFRDFWVDADTADRFEEVVGLSGIYINPYVVRKTLERRSLEAAGLDKTALHSSQLLARDGLLDFVKDLDAVASEEWCTNIFMGEVVPKDFVKDYTAFKQEALQRQESLKDMAETVANFVLDLAANGFDRQKAPQHVEAFVKKLLLELGKKDFAVAEQMFDETTARGLQKVAYLEQQGRADEAFRLQQEVEKAAPGGGFCGAGCGIETVSASSPEGKRLAKLLGANSGYTLAKDKERKCKCGSKRIAYAYTSRKYIKACDDCGSREEKVSVVSTQSDYELAA